MPGPTCNRKAAGSPQKKLLVSTAVATLAIVMFLAIPKTCSMPCASSSVVEGPAVELPGDTLCERNAALNLLESCTPWLDSRG